ncbi:hypothetical protein B0H13DRAFT_2666318 [Mycena leptocephala]|nr:hypothetical protein B0H13DRAFT_2666318 [Mycena leptocephala]
MNRFTEPTHSSPPLLSPGYGDSFFPPQFGADNCSSDGTPISLPTSRVSKVLLASESHCESWTKTRLGGVRAAAKTGDALDQVLTSFRLCPRPSHSSSERSSDWIEAATDFDFGHGSCSGDLDFDKRHSRGWGVAWTHDQRVRACQIWIARDGLADGWIPGIDAARSRMGVYESTLGATALKVICLHDDERGLALHACARARPSTGAAWTNTAAARTGVAHSCGPLVDAHRCAERDDRADGRVVELDGSCSYVHPSTRTGTRVYGGEYGKVEARASGRQQDEEGGDYAASVRRHRLYSTARGADDPRSMAIHRPSSATLPLGRSEVGLHSGIETHMHLPRNRCRSQPRTPHPALYGDSPDGGSDAGSEERTGATRSPWTPTPHIRTRLAFPTAPPSAHLRYPTASSVRALSSIQITIQITWRAQPRQQTSRTSRLLTPLRLVGWERADRPRGQDVQQEFVSVASLTRLGTPLRILPLRFLDSTSLIEPLTRSLTSCVVCESASTHAVFVCGSLPRRGRSNGRRSPRSCTCAPARRPSCACACRPIPYGTRTALYLPFLDLYNTTRALTSTCTRLLPLVQTLPSRRGSRAPRDWALREAKEGRRVPPPPPVSTRITTTGTTVHKQESLPCLMFLGPLPILWILVLGWVRFVSRGHGGEALVSFRFHPQLSPPLSFRQRPGYPVSITFYIRNRLFMLFL